MNEQTTMASHASAPLDGTTGPGIAESLAIKDLKRLYRLSRVVRALSLFWLLCASFAVVLVASPRSALSSIGTIVYIGFALLAIAAAFAGWRFLLWGRVLGLVVSAVLLLAFPIGTLFGILGLFAFWRAKPLFGANRLADHALKAELAQRKSTNAA